MHDTEIPSTIRKVACLLVLFSVEVFIAAGVTDPFQSTSPVGLRLQSSLRSVAMTLIPKEAATIKAYAGLAVSQRGLTKRWSRLAITSCGMVSLLAASCSTFSLAHKGTGMDRQECVAVELRKAIARIDDVLVPWGFAFIHDGVSSSHQGPYASGHYVRDNTRIGVSCRDTIDNIAYSHSIVRGGPYCEETERFTIGHETLMRSLGALADCWLVIATDDLGPSCVRARNGADPVEAWKHDLLLAESVLKQPCDAFVAIMRSGARAYSVSPKSSGEVLDRSDAR